MNTLSDWGKDDNKKFVVMHYSILSEGINVHGLTHCILLRNLNIVAMAQTIGRVIRMHKRTLVILLRDAFLQVHVSFIKNQLVT